MGTHRALGSDGVPECGEQDGGQCHVLWGLGAAGCGPCTGLHPEWPWRGAECTCVWGAVSRLSDPDQRAQSFLPPSPWWRPHQVDANPPHTLKMGPEPPQVGQLRPGLRSRGFRALPPPHFGSSKLRPKNVNWSWDVQASAKLWRYHLWLAPGPQAGGSTWSMRLTPDPSGDTPEGGSGGGSQLHSSKAWRPWFQGRADREGILVLQMGAGRVEGLGWGPSVCSPGAGMGGGQAEAGA